MVKKVPLLPILLRRKWKRSDVKPAALDQGMRKCPGWDAHPGTGQSPLTSSRITTLGSHVQAKLFSVSTLVFNGVHWWPGARMCLEWHMEGLNLQVRLPRSWSVVVGHCPWAIQLPVALGYLGSLNIFIQNHSLYLQSLTWAKMSAPASLKGYKLEPMYVIWPEIVQKWFLSLPVIIWISKGEPLLKVCIQTNKFMFT